MDGLINEIEKCNVCGSFPKLRNNLIQKGKTNFIIIGESPARNGWLESGKAFYDKSGKLQASGKILERLLNILNLHIEDIYFTECCKCFIADRTKLEMYSKNCFPFLERQISSIDCQYIITMGKFPTQQLLKQEIKHFSDYVGKLFDIEVKGKKYHLLPIYHPSPANPKGYKDNVPIFEKYKSLLMIK